MSSNAFARSRPRVRHQRVPKTQCYAHPRFLQLVKELTRLDDEKRKREEPGHSGSKGGGSSHKANIAGNFTNNACISSDDRSDPTPTPNQPQIVAHQRQPHHHHHHHHLHHNHQSSSQQQQAHQHQPHQNSHHHHQQQHSSTDCWPSTNSLAGANCCNINDAHSSNGCRSIECMQSTSTLNNNYYRQNNDYLIGSIYNQMHRQHSYPSNQQQHDASINNHLSHHQTHHHPQHQDNRCPPKCTTSSSAASSSNANNNFGYSKASLIEQQSTTNQSNSDPDARQDENRTKRKRSSNDSSNCGKKIISPGSPSSCSKRHKSSPEPARPLSPSFTKCPICLLDCMDRDPSFTNTCFHLFCFVCIENWSKSKATCPLCRTKFSKIIYNIRSASCFDEKVASPIRREDDDDRIIYEQLHGLNANNLDPRRTTTTSRNDDTRMLFDNLSPGDVLMPHFALLNHSLNRHVSALHSFNSVTSNSDFNLNVPNGFAAPVYNHAGSNYIALIPNDRSQATANNPAITSAYTPNTSLTNISSDSSNRLPRMSRSGRFLYSRNYDLSTTDGSARVSRATNTDSTQTGISLEPRHQVHFNNNQHHHHSQHPQHPPQHRSTVATIEVGHRQSQRVGPPSHLPYLGPFRPYTNPFVPRRPEGSAEQHILNNLYHQMPDI